MLSSLLLIVVLVVLSFSVQSFVINQFCSPILTRLNAVDEINSVEQFDEALKAHADSFFVVDYSTTWCGPCKLALPKFVALSEKYPSVKFFKCIGDATPEGSLLMKREGIRSVPAFHFWKNGAKIDMVNGARIDDVEQVIKSNI